MQISTTVLNAMLNGEFNTEATTYSLKLLFDGSPSESDPETIDFTAASGGLVQLASSAFFAITAGTTITGLQVLNSADDVLIEEGFADVVYLTNGTFTVNNITVTVATAI